MKSLFNTTLQSNSSSSSSSSSSGSDPLQYAIVPNPDNQIVFNPFNYPLPIQEEAHISQFVVAVENELMKTGNRPSQMIDAVVNTYKTIRASKMKMMKKPNINKSKKKIPLTAFKGLNKDMIVACIIRCEFFTKNRYFPNRILVQIFQNALRQVYSGRKKSSVLIKHTSDKFLQVFEDYLFNPKKHIVKELKETIPKCYESKPMSVFRMAQFTSNHFFKFVSQETQLLRKITEITDEAFGDTTSVGDKALFSIFVVIVHSKKRSIDEYKKLNMTQDKLTKLYENIYEKLKKIIPEPIYKSYLFSKRKEASVK